MEYFVYNLTCLHINIEYLLFNQPSQRLHIEAFYSEVILDLLTNCKNGTKSSHIVFTSNVNINLDAMPLTDSDLFSHFALLF